MLWYYADFGPTGGPPTLSVKAAGKGCYTVHAFDDNGGSATVSGLVVHIGSKRSIKATTDTNVCPGPHPGVAGARDRHRRGSLERGEVRPALVLVLAFAVTGCGGGREHGTATLWVTRDRGAQVLYTGTVPAGLTAMQALERVRKVSTRYGGRFVQSIDGVEGSATQQRDWFYFVDGIEGDRSAAEVTLQARRRRVVGLPRAGRAAR